MHRMKSNKAAVLLLSLAFGIVCVGASAQPLTTQTREMTFAIWADARGSNFISHASSMQMIGSLRSARFNTVLLQVRHEGDAYYVSATEPRASIIETGYLDPLADVLFLCRPSNIPERIKVFPWFTMLRAFTADIYPTPPARNVISLHPEWLSEDANGNKTDEAKAYYLDPGVPAVHEYLTNVVLEVVSKYDIDGVLLSGLAYPQRGLNWGYNPLAVARFNEETNHSGKPLPDDPDWCQWRRDQVTALVKTLSQAVEAIKPKIVFAVAAEIDGSAPTSAEDFKASPIYKERFQDWLGWAQEGIVDAVFVKTFFRQPTERDQFEQWVKFATADKGKAATIIGVSGEMNFTDHIVQQMRFVRSSELADGIALWSYGSPAKDDWAVLFKLLGTNVFAKEYVAVQKPRLPRYEPPVPLHVEERSTTPVVAVETKPTTPTVEIELAPQEGVTTPVVAVIPVVTITPGETVAHTGETTPVAAILAPARAGGRAGGEVVTTPTVAIEPVAVKEATPPPTPAPTPEIKIPPLPQKTWDTIYLVNGGSFEGKIIDEVQGRAVIETPAGLKIIVPVSDIKKVVRIIE